MAGGFFQEIGKDVWLGLKRGLARLMKFRSDAQYSALGSAYLAFPWRNGTVVVRCGIALTEHSVETIERNIGEKIDELQLQWPRIEEQLRAKVTDERPVWQVSLTPSEIMITPVASIEEFGMRVDDIAIEHLSIETSWSIRQRTERD